MAIKTHKFDAARYLKLTEAQVELLNDALESHNAAYIANALGVIARTRGISNLSRSTGLSREGLYKALSKKGDPQLSTLLAVLRSLGFSLTAKKAA